MFSDAGSTPAASTKWVENCDFSRFFIFIPRKIPENVLFLICILLCENSIHDFVKNCKYFFKGRAEALPFSHFFPNSPRIARQSISHKFSSAVSFFQIGMVITAAVPALTKITASHKNGRIASPPFCSNLSHRHLPSFCSTGKRRKKF